MESGDLGEGRLVQGERDARVVRPHRARTLHGKSTPHATPRTCFFSSTSTFFSFSRACVDMTRSASIQYVSVAGGRMLDPVHSCTAQAPAPPPPFQA